MRLDGTTGASAHDFSMRAQESSPGNPMDCRGDLRVGACAGSVRDLRDLDALTSRESRGRALHTYIAVAHAVAQVVASGLRPQASEPRERGVDRYRCDLQFSRSRRGKL